MAFALLLAAPLCAGQIELNSGWSYTPTGRDIGSAITQSSKPTPFARIDYRIWRGFGLESTFTPTTTRLHDNPAIYTEFNRVNQWRMQRLSLDPTYTQRLGRHWFVRGGAGAMMTLSGKAQNGIPVGADQRFEEIAGLDYTRGRMIWGYTAHFVRNPDFSDHGWHAQRNVISEFSVGIILPSLRRPK
jgi:hypothetical protein